MAKVKCQTSEKLTYKIMWQNLRAATLMSGKGQRRWNWLLQTLGPFVGALVNYQIPWARVRQKQFIQHMSPRGTVPPMTLIRWQIWVAMFSAIETHPNLAITDGTRVEQAIYSLSKETLDQTECLLHQEFGIGELND